MSLQIIIRGPIDGLNLVIVGVQRGGGGKIKKLYDKSQSSLIN